MRVWFSRETDNMELPDVRTLVPHAGRMVLLDRVVFADEENLCAEVRILPESLFCFDGVVGSWVGIEYMAQAIGAWAGYTALLRGEPVKRGFLLGTRRYECLRPFFFVGALLRIYVRRLLQEANGLASFECRIEDENGVVASGNLSVFQSSQPAEISEQDSA
jgi:predicted hotdog family 3-hydroxylacyl-ACP dehydratase